MLHNLRGEVEMSIESDTKELLNSAGWLCMPWYLLTCDGRERKSRNRIGKWWNKARPIESYSSAYNNSDEKEKHNVVSDKMRDEESRVQVRASRCHPNEL